MRTSRLKISSLATRGHQVRLQRDVKEARPFVSGQLQARRGRHQRGNHGGRFGRTVKSETFGCGMVYFAPTVALVMSREDGESSLCAPSRAAKKKLAFTKARAGDGRPVTEHVVCAGIPWTAKQQDEHLKPEIDETKRMNSLVTAIIPGASCPDGARARQDSSRPEQKRPVWNKGGSGTNCRRPVPTLPH